MLLDIPDIVELYERKGAAWYGSERVSQLEHALQCAALAESEGASEALVAASLLHDIGHLLAERAHATDRSRDDVHQYLALPFLRQTFDEEVLEPIRLHVDAKRYLCRAEPKYWDGLSPASKHSLELQGGVFSPEQAGRFGELAFARDAVRLRRWDDLAKRPGAPTPGLAHYAQVLERCVRVRA